MRVTRCHPPCWGDKATDPFLEGKLLSFLRAIFHPELRPGLILFFIWFVQRSPRSSRAALRNYFLELAVSPNKARMSTMACFTCLPKRWESVSGLENLEEMWKWMKFSPTMMYDTP